MIEMVGKIMELSQMKEQLKKEYGVLDVSCDVLTEEIEVHIWHEHFFKIFETYSLVIRDSKSMPYKAIKYDDGIKFFTLLDENEYKKFVLKEAV